MTEKIFKHGENSYKYQEYRNDETFLEYTYPILILYVDDNFNFNEPYLYRKITKVNDILEIEKSKYDFIFVFPVIVKGQLPILEETLKKVITFSDVYFS